MKNLWKGGIPLVLIGVVAAPIGPGCVHAEAPFFIRSAKAISCDTVTVDTDDLGQGRMDVRYSCSYSAVLELGNELVKRGDETKLQVETSRISVTAFDVQVLDSQGAVAGEFTVPSTGFVDPSNAGEPGYGLAGALLVDGATSQALAAQGGGLITARVIAHGRTLGGDDITSRPWDFPIFVCDGCLCGQPADDTCVNSMAAPKEQCFIAQDNQFDCRFLGGHDCSEQATCGVFK